MKARVLMLLLAATLGCAGAPAESVPDEQIGLSYGEIDHVAVPDPVTENLSEPGELPRVARAFPEAPPEIPHGISDFLPIVRDENLCLDCHGAVEEKVEGEPTPLPPSHRTDLRNDPSAVRDEVVGARYVCTSCHVPSNDVSPLVENRFGS